MNREARGSHPWNASALRQSFRATAVSAESYWNQSYPKVASQPAYESLVDEAIAKFYVFDALGSRAWNTPGQLTKVARALLVWDVQDSQIFDPGRVRQHQQRHLNALIEEYGG